MKGIIIMKRFLLCMTLLFALLMSLTVAVSAEEALRHYVDFAGMDATTELTADDIGAYAIENVKVAEFNAEGNILAAKENGKPSYVIYKLSASEGNTLSSLMFKSYASVNDFGNKEAGLDKVGNKFGIYVNTTGEFNPETDTALKEGMVGKMNHKWDLTDAVKGQSEVYVCVYFLNNSDFVDWVRFYSFDLTAEEAAPAPETSETEETAPTPETSETEETTVPESESETTKETEEKEETTTDETTDAVDTTTKAPTDNEGDASANPIAIVLIVAGSLIAIIVIVALVVILKKK